jgi:dolichol-phosphate mannosyltransferase
VYENKTYYFDRIKSCIGKKEDFSIIIPTYNEEKSIRKLINLLNHVLLGNNYKIIIVDDSSYDDTPRIINQLTKNNNVIALHRKGIKGIFSAIQDGINLSNSGIIVIMDADFSHPPEIVPKLLEHIENFDTVSASRFINNAGIEAPVSRKYSTIILNKIVRIILGLRFRDITGGFHAIKKSKFKELNFRYKSIWGEFDMELFYRANKLGFKIKEIPFVYKFRNEGHSKSESLLKYAWIYFVRALQLRFSNF